MRSILYTVVTVVLVIAAAAGGHRQLRTAATIVENMDKWTGHLLADHRVH